MPKTGTLTKARIVDAAKETNGYTQQKAFETVKIMIELIKSTLETGEDVMISNFGKFCVNNNSQRRGRNPATGDPMIRPARRVVTFKCSVQLRDRCNRAGCGAGD